MWQGRSVVLGVAGGIAAYKSVILARELARRGAQVDVVLSRGAGEFVGAASFEAITRRPVRRSLWEPGTALDHLSLSRAADLVIVAPATAHLLARAAAGFADDLLTALLLASTTPVLAAPAMNDDMFAHPATRANLATLLQRGWCIVGPAIGDLAEGPSDRPGRMAEPDEIISHAARLLHRQGPLAGRRVVVTAGPTRESIDPVRVVTNRSSGRMGFRLAQAAWERGADVILISGPSREAAPPGVDVVRVETTAQMAGAVGDHLVGTDVLIMAAAPSDYRPAQAHPEKLARRDGALHIDLEPTEDILETTRRRRPPAMTVVGFALETGDAVEKATRKLHHKGLDIIVANDALAAGAGFEVDTNAVTIIDRSGTTRSISLRDKRAVADAILDFVEQYRG